MKQGEPVKQVSPELQRFMEERGKEIAQKVSAISGAGADPLPGPLYDAFCKGAIKIREGLVVRKVVARDWVILRALNSPFLKLIDSVKAELVKEGEDRSNPEVEISDEDAWVVVWIFTRPMKDVREAFESKGVDELKRLADTEIGEELSASEVNVAMMSIMEQVRRTWSTGLKYSVELQEKGEVNFFPDSEASPKTASDGGQTT